jgi:LysR family hydrogen peroxide-inducible transcriptional activator
MFILNGCHASNAWIWSGMRNEIQFPWLEHFVVLARTRNFTRAAEELNMSQSSLSRSIQRLEEQMNQSLFDRRPREVILTDAGELLLEKAKAILREVDDLFFAISQVGRKSRIRLGVIPTIAPYFLPEFLEYFCESFPEIGVTVLEDTTDHLIRRCEHGEIDLVILSLPVDASHLQVEPLFEEELLLVLPAGHALAKGKKVKMEALADYPFVMLNEAHCLADSIASFCRRKSVQPVTIERTSQLITVQELVALGHGVSIVPAMASKLDVSDRRVYRSFRGDAPRRTVAMLWNDNRAQTEPLRQMRDALRCFARIR